MLTPVSDSLYPNRKRRRYKYRISYKKLNLGYSFDSIVSSQGCPFNCKFCSFKMNPLGQKRDWSARTPESTLQELKEIDAKVVAFIDDNFFVDIERVEKICDLIIEAKLIKAPVFFLAVGSQANVGGAASAPIVASAFHPALAPVGVLLAVLGYALGTYCAWQQCNDSNHHHSLQCSGPSPWPMYSIFHCPSAATPGSLEHRYSRRLPSARISASRSIPDVAIKTVRRG